MKKGHTYRHGRRGLTLVEMSVAMTISSVMFLAVMNVLASNHKNFNQTYERVNGQLTREATEARAIFEVLARQSTMRTYRIWTDGSAREYAEVYYYHDQGAPTLDRYAQFCFDPGATTLTVEYGAGHLAWDGTENRWYYDGGATTYVIAHHVTACTFTQLGPTMSMSAVLNDGKVDLPVTVTATRHNE